MLRYDDGWQLACRRLAVELAEYVLALPTCTSIQHGNFMLTDPGTALDD